MRMSKGDSGHVYGGETLREGVHGWVSRDLEVDKVVKPGKK